MAIGGITGHITLVKPIKDVSAVPFITTISTPTGRPITELAPLVDSKIFAIGSVNRYLVTCKPCTLNYLQSRFQNGWVIIAALQPTFSVLYTFESTIAPSCLAWHISSPRRSSLLLAGQMDSGDVRVWSVPRKPNPLVQQPKVVRFLPKTKGYHQGFNWMAWSKNGHIIQHSGRHVTTTTIGVTSKSSSSKVADNYSAERHCLGTLEPRILPASE